MCKIHHAAYDRRILGVRPDYTIAVREDVLREVDGPMLRHGLQEMHDARLHLPKRVGDLPDRDALAERWAAFAR
jgi:putative restriction endonuclease